MHLRGVGKAGRIGPGSADLDDEADPCGKGRQRSSNRRLAQNHHRRRGQHRLDEDVHDAPARAAGAEVDDVAELSAGAFRADADQLRPARVEHRFGGFDNGRTTAVAADPAVQRSVGVDNGLGAGFARGGGLGAHHRDERVALVRRPQLGGEIENVVLGVHDTSSVENALYRRTSSRSSASRLSRSCAGANRST